MIREPARRAAMELLLRAGETVRMPVKGRSMLPTFAEGAEIEIEPLRRVPRRGDIVVFREGSRWIAHRVIRVEPGVVVCAGDAQPESLERVKRDAIGGIVRVSGLARIAGWGFSISRPVRSWLRRSMPMFRERVYKQLVDIAGAMVRGDDRELLACVERCVPWKVASVARKHRIAAMLGKSLAPLIAQSDTASALASRVAPDQYRALLQAPRYRTQVCDVVRLLRANDIEPLLLKGAARAIVRDAEADLFASCDIDVLVYDEEVDHARNALRAGGYHERPSRMDYTGHHHLAPLFPPGGGVPVEIHHRLTAGSVGKAWDHGSLFPYERCCDDDELQAYILDDVGTAFHHALHAHARPELREVVMLARLLRRMRPGDIREFKVMLCCVDQGAAVAVEAVAAFAAQLAGIPWETSERVRDYVAWSIVREDLPRPLRTYPACVDAWRGASGTGRFVAAVRAAREAHGSSKRVLGAWARIACGIVTPIYARFMR